MLSEKLGLVLQGLLDRRLIVDLLLGPAFDTEVPKFQRVNFALEKIQCICALIHEIYFCDHPNCSITLGVYFPRNLQSVRVGQVGVGGRERQYQSIARCDVLNGKTPDLLLDVLRLTLHGYFGQAWQVDQSQIDQLFRVNCQSNWRRRNTLGNASYLLGLGHDFRPNIIKIKEPVIGSMQELGILPLLFNLVVFVRRPHQSPQLQDEWAPGHNARSSW